MKIGVLTAVLLLLAGAFAWIDPLPFPQGGWQYRVPIAVSNNGSALTDYQVAVNTTNLAYNNTGLAGSWHFSEASGTSFSDMSGNGNAGTYNGETLNTATLNNFGFAPGSGWADGKYGKALQFDGVNDYVTYGSAGIPTGNSARTMEAWVKSSASGALIVVDAGAQAINQEFGLGYEIGGDTRGIWVDYWGGGCTSGVFGTPGQWDHIAATFDGSNVNLYLNGNLIKTCSGVSLSTGSTYRTIGTRINNAWWFNGAIDDVRIYGRALSASEIQQTYQNNTFIRSGLVSYWRFDENAGAVAQDTHHIATQDNRNGTKFGNALTFDGSNDYVNAGSSASLAFSNAVTLEAWINPQTFSGYGPVFGKSGDYSTKRAQFIWLANPASPQLYSTLNNNVCIQNSAVGSVPLNAWSHVAFTFDGATAKLYINGTQVSSVACAMTLADNSATPLTLGFDSNNIYYFAGTIDEARAYNRTLSAQEIAQHYSAGMLRLDYGDLRFANSSDSSLPYWMEGDNKAWVRVPYVPSGASTVYAYYGNPNATGTSSGSAVFDFFDDFENGAIETSKWTRTIDAGWSVAGGLLKSTDSTGKLTSVPTFSSPLVAETKMKVVTTANYGGVMPIGFKNGIGDSFAYWYDQYWSDDGYVLNSWPKASFSSGSLPPSNVFVLYRIIANSSGSAGMAAINYNNGTVYRNQSVTKTITNLPFVINRRYDDMFGANTQENYWDWFRVRKYSYPEPSLSLQSEEFVSPAALLSILPASKTTYPNYNETFTLYVYNNQSVADNFTLSCSGTCYYSENPVVTTARQNKSVSVTITSAAAAGTASYPITATSQANAAKSSSVAVSMTADASNWRSQWVDAYGNAYAYRTPITITNAGAALADYQVAVNLTGLVYNNTGLVASWHFSEGTGTRAADSSGFGKDGTLNGFEFNANSNWAPGKFGNGLRFDGSNDYVYASADMSNDNTYSFEFWLYDTSTTNSGYRRWVTTTSGVVTANTAMIREADGGYLQIYAGTTAATSAAGGGWWKNSWHQFVYVSNGTSTRVYMDGNSTPVLTAAVSVDPETNVYMGGYYTSGPSEFYKGVIDELRVYNYALSPQDIAQHYNASKLRPDYADLKFKNSSDAPLPYWLESDSLAWVRVPYVLSGASTVYAYYGSPGTQSAASGNATFDFFDDFSGDLGKWTVNGVSITSGYAAIATTGTGWGNYMYSNMSFDRSSRGYELTLSHRIKGTTWNQHETYMGFGSAASGPLVQPKEAWNQAGQTNGGNNYNLGWSDAGGTGVVASGSPSIANLWKRFTVRINQGSGGLLSTDVTPATYTLTGADNNMRVKVNAYTGGADVDDVRVRKYALPEPSLSFQQEEIPNPTILLSISPQGKTTYPNYPEAFALNVTNNQNFTDGFNLSCGGACSYSENPVSLAANQTKTVSVTVTSANVSGTTAYAITATSQANASNFASVSASLTVDATKWRDQWTDAYGSGFRYRVPITINNSGSALSDYQVNVTIDTSAPIGLARMRSDCGDIRVTNGTNEMPYWIEGGCNTSSTKIWARVPYVPAGNSTIYAYYGNAAAANKSSGKSTFDGYWSWDNSSEDWVLTGGSGSGNAWFEPTAGNPPGDIVADCCNCGPVPWYISWNLPSMPYAVKFQTRSQVGYDGGLRFKVQNSAGAWTALSDECLYNTPWTWKGEFVYTGSVSKLQFEQYAANCGQGSNCFGEYRWVDNLIIRKYASPAPSALSGAEQSKGYRLLVRRCGAKQANATVTAYYPPGVASGNCTANQNGICSLEIGSGTYDLQLTFADNSTAWKNATSFG